jgi:hypothetical protein
MPRISAGTAFRRYTRCGRINESSTLVTLVVLVRADLRAVPLAQKRRGALLGTS